MDTTISQPGAKHMTDETPTPRYNYLHVIVESPYANDDPLLASRNKRYALAACHDCYSRGEAAFASHLFYTQFLEDDDPNERREGMAMGCAWMERADLVAVYVDLGISAGMMHGIEEASAMGIRIEFREIEGWDQPTNYTLTEGPPIA